ncbi:hypothetical protein [Winogradskyella forsetii]|uniref:hypothetical protein n=1 Tax=Winogradskyella forsetii TaxID=2686077 RepID=UPI0015C151E6|nr:hypothetical protein [Winogradskyella forsetii]
MIITKDFVFIHMPKTGGTFVHGIFKKIIAKYKKNNALHWYANRLALKMNLAIPIYQKIDTIKYYEHPNNPVVGQHAGVSFIPTKYRMLPVISVKRDPVKKFISAYYYRWWERFPTLSITELELLFPHYPDITIEEYFKLAYDIEMKKFFESDFREDIGVLSWQFIRMYSTDPLYVYNNITQQNYSEFVKTYFVNVQFFEMNTLNSDFEAYIKTTSFSEYSDFFETSERIYPPGSNIKKRSEKISNELSETLMSREWLLYNFFPEYKL